MRKIFILLLIIPFLGIAQNPQLSKAIDKVVADLRKGKDAQLEVSYYVPENYSLIITKGVKLKEDTISSVRKFAFTLIAKAGFKSTIRNEKTSAVDQLCSGISDNDFTIASLCANALEDYTSDLFNVRAKATIESALADKKGDLEQLCKLAGYLQLKNTEKDLFILYNQRYYGEDVQWAAQLALARLGNSNAIAATEKTVSNAQVGDNMMYYLMPDVLYTCNKKLYKPFIEIMYSDEKQCVSANPYNEKYILCGYRVIEKLAKYIKDYPLETFRTGAIKGKSYEEALKIAKEWFKTKGDNYEINTSVF